MAPAEAAPSEGQPDDVARARAAFLRGVDLAKVGRWNEARGAFEDSDAVVPHAVTKYNVGFCARALGLYARAEWAFNAALADDERTRNLPEELRASGRELLVESRKRRANAEFVAEPGMRLLVDGRPLEPLPSTSGGAVYLAGIRPPGAAESLQPGRIELRLDPGMHVFQLTGVGLAAPPVVQNFQPGEVRVLRFGNVVDDKAPRASSRELPAEPTGPGWPVVATSSVGLAGVATGTVFGVLALTLHSELSSECSAGQCSPSHASDITRLHTYEDVATTGFVVGGVALVAAGVLWLTGAGREPRRAGDAVASRSGVRLRVSPSGVAGVF
jgi:hypothetical protein